MTPQQPAGSPAGGAAHPMVMIAGLQEEPELLLKASQSQTVF